MQIVSFEVSYKEVCSLPGYSNVAIEQSLAAVVEEGEDPTIARERAFTTVKAFVQEQIDTTLEDNDQAPKYSTEPRYILIVNHDQKILALVPKISPTNLPDGYSFSYPVNQMRLAKANRKIEHLLLNPYQGFTLVECTDGDLSKLPKQAETP